MPGWLGGLVAVVYGVAGVLAILHFRRRCQYILARLASLEQEAIERPAAAAPKWQGGVKPQYVTGKPGQTR